MAIIEERSTDDLQKIEQINTSSFKIQHASYIFEFKNDGLKYATEDCNELSNSFEFFGASWMLGLVASPIQNTDDLRLRIYIIKKRSKRLLSKVRWRLSLLDENKEKIIAKEGEMRNDAYQFQRVLTEPKGTLQALGLMTEDSVLISLELTVTDTFPERICLKDNQDQRNEWMNLSNDLLALYESKGDADFTLHVKEEKFPVHKLILSARSNVFKAMFTHEMREKKENYADIRDVEPSAMKYLLIYIYSGTIPDISFEGLCDLFVTSDMYAVLDLKRRCMHQMLFLMTEHNVWQALRIAEKYDKMLMDASLNFITRHPRIMLGNKWKKFNKSDAKLSIFILNEYIARTVLPISQP